MSCLTEYIDTGNEVTYNYKQYLRDEEGAERGEKPFSIIDGIYTQHKTDDIRPLFEDYVLVQFPKPVSLIKEMLEIASPSGSEDDIIIDFFSGSCTTAHAVLDLNNEDGGDRKFIMVQLPEPCDEKSEAYKAAYKPIADIGKERIRRVISKVKKEREGELDLDTGKKKQDLGFRVFKLAPSNFKTWQGDQTDPERIREQLEFHINHRDPQATSEDILYELLLKAGFPLTTAVETIDISGKTAYSVADGALIICLDAAFHENDQLKTNAVQIMESAEVQFRTV